MKYKSVMVPRRGGPEVLQLVENELRPPEAGEVRVESPGYARLPGRHRRTGGQSSIPAQAAVHTRLFNRWLCGRGRGWRRRRALRASEWQPCMKYGGYSEFVYLKKEILAPVPRALDLAKASVLILNYLVAYQLLHRVAQVRPTDKVLLIGSTGGVGTAFLQLGKLAGIPGAGLASPRKHAILVEYGATPIDYHTQDFVRVLRQAEPGGIDFVFNGMGKEYFARGLAVLRRGGKLMHPGAPQSFGSFLLLVTKLGWYNLLPNGKKIAGYGTHRLSVDLFQQDWAVLFRLLEEGQIQPVIERAFPLVEAARANALLESGSVTGNLVLLAPELL